MARSPTTEETLEALRKILWDHLGAHSEHERMMAYRDTLAAAPEEQRQKVKDYWK